MKIAGKKKIIVILVVVFLSTAFLCGCIQTNGDNETNSDNELPDNGDLEKTDAYVADHQPDESRYGPDFEAEVVNQANVSGTIEVTLYFYDENDDPIDTVVKELSIDSQSTETIEFHNVGLPDNTESYGIEVTKQGHEYT
ncbi:hypothetical protein [Methanonatronarchaeum sp. AMET-Sl]|uniref:hypothetical protein n=1 Tax=Methanonatronarchaeum sp. AMET-Sl TaxID=3037654 RepID=UPI00244DE932|nr:hypothetical protein [Methanonatronarchaeum sp. AMET-Sl]WGI17676.1 hypothetical protein QEN48_01320 [Methanonatronarchaeum sp. AMET-Sl]